LYDNGLAIHPLESWEYKLGDGHYSHLPYFMTPFREQHNRQLSLWHYYMNSMVTHYRSRIEHVNCRIEKHNVFRTPFRGNVTLLADIIKVVVHTTNIFTRMYPPYETCGPWSHNPKE